MKRFIFTVLFSMIAPTLIQADFEFEPTVSRYYIENVSEKVMHQITSEFEVVRRNGNGFEVNVVESQKERFRQLAPLAKVLSEDIALELGREIEQFADQEAEYRRLPEVMAWMQQLAENHPETVMLVNYGKSKQGRDLVALKISDNVQVDEDEPELMITSATHGDEIITTEVLLRLIDELVSGQERHQKMIAGTEMYFIPVVNPDGFSRRSRYSGGVDPNRSYPHPETGHQRSKADCIERLMEFFEEREFAGSIDFHAYGHMVMYPWAYTRTKIEGEKEPVLSQLAEEMARENGYRHGQISRVIYIAPGSSADYYYWKKGTLAMAVELGFRKAPPPSRIPSVVTEAREMTWKFVEKFVAEKAGE